jgi:shikimate kinase
MKIFLVGMMGSGKNYWMDRLGRKLKLPKYDLDHLIEGVEDRKIQQIFGESGEDHFRKMESLVLRWFSDKDDFILATGGGTPCFYENMDWMNEQGITIWLDEATAILAERLIPEKAHRPLIAHLSNENLAAYLDAKKEEREIFYSKAKYKLSGDEITEENLLSLLNK